MEAVINHRQNKKRGRLSHKRIYVDLTPMVDLGFLLITFFMLSITLSDKRAASLVMPKETHIPTPVKESAVLTLMPVRNNLVRYYEGREESPEHTRYCSYAELRKVILEKKNKVAAELGDRNETVILIAPGRSSTYKNFVDILDEIAINDIRYYFVLDRVPENEE